MSGFRPEDPEAEERWLTEQRQLSNSVTQADLDKIVSQVSESLNALAMNVQQTLDTIQQNVETIEETVASLVMGFAEQTVMIEAITGQLSLETPEEQEAFTRVIAEGRMAMLKLMQEHVDVVAESDSGSSESMEHLDDTDETSSTS